MDQRNANRRLAFEGWSLRQRLHWARHAARAAEVSDVARECDDAELELWRQAISPAHNDGLPKRTRWSGLDYRHIRAALQAPLAAAPPDPPWMQRLPALQSACRKAAGRPRPDNTGCHPSLPFEDIWLPICEWGCAELVRRVAPDALQAVEPGALDDICRSLLRRLSWLGEQVLFTEFNRVRSTGALLLGLAVGDSGAAGPRERRAYSSFVSKHLADGLDTLLQAYPVLGRLIATVVDLWLQSSRELLERVHRDRRVLAARLGVAADLHLVRVRTDLSDSHHGGRTVAVLEFGASRCISRVVYKPKDLGIDAAYQDCLARLNSLAQEETFRVVGVVAMQGYGYMEYVAHQPCTHREQVERFYANAGRLLSVIHVLGGTDCHHENLIACGDQLLLVDAETLFEGDAAGTARPLWDSDVRKSISHCVLRTGMLPQWGFVGAHNRHPVDISALGVSCDSRDPLAAQGWLNVNTDLMCWGAVNRNDQPLISLPFPAGTESCPGEFSATICAAFRTQMAFFIEHRDALLAPSPRGLLARFSHLRRRVVIRATRVYSLIQRQALEPSALTSALSRGLRLEQLCRNLLIADEKPTLWPVFDAELMQMERLDVPIFVQRVGSDSIDGPGLASPVRKYFARPGLEACAKRLERLDGREIDFQARLIDGALAARRPGAVHAVAAGSGRSEPHGRLVSGEALRAEAFRLGLVLRRQAIPDSLGGVEWLGLDLGPDQATLRSGLVDASLYAGRAGIALFMAAVSEIAPGHDRKRYRALARAAVAEPLAHIAAADRLARRRWLRGQTFGLTGIGGLLLALLLLDRLKIVPRAQDPFRSYGAAAVSLADALDPDDIGLDTEADQIAGCAGLIGPLLMIARRHGDKNGLALQPLRLATSAGSRLAGLQNESGGWRTRGGGAPQTGFSHGAGGIAAALAQLHRATSDPRFLHAARRGLEYERRCHLAAHADPSVSEPPLQRPNGWCHGAPGIAVARMSLRATALWDEQSRRDLSVALDTTASTGAEVDHLCCGALGRAAVLQFAATRLSQPQWRQRAAELRSATVLEAKTSLGRYRTCTRREQAIRLPGLFTGTAGIGLALIGTRTSDGILEGVLTAGLGQ